MQVPEAIGSNRSNGATSYLIKLLLDNIINIQAIIQVQRLCDLQVASTSSCTSITKMEWLVSFINSPSVML